MVGGGGRARFKISQHVPRFLNLLNSINAFFNLFNFVNAFVRLFQPPQRLFQLLQLLQLHHHQSALRFVRCVLQNSVEHLIHLTKPLWRVINDTSYKLCACTGGFDNEDALTMPPVAFPVHREGVTVPRPRDQRWLRLPAST